MTYNAHLVDRTKLLSKKKSFGIPMMKKSERMCVKLAYGKVIHF